ncbi:MAG TPA: site-2 protease family protein [Chloroflexi bacterium]|nr:site-2 protease family protein [Chloroflexota bacterium]
MDQNGSGAEKPLQVENISQLIAEILEIDHFILGDKKDDFLIRFRGKLTRPSEEAHHHLSSSLTSHQVTPWFRSVEDQVEVTLRKTISRAELPNQRINYLLFLITFASILFAGILTVYDGPQTMNIGLIWANSRVRLGQAIAFAISLLSILTAHEFGHYFAARYHKTKVTLPFFIPFPLSPFGTMGAFIQLLEPPRNKKVLLDIGLAGPLAGLLVTIPVLIIGLSLSVVEKIPVLLPEHFIFEGNSLFYLGLKHLIHGAWLPEPTSFDGIAPFFYWVRYFFTGYPIPRGGLDVIIHPVAWAGWAGLLVTSLNLIPAGQFDGGHLIYSLYGKRLKWLRPLIMVILVILGFLWSGWWLWAFMILLLGNRYAEPLDEITELDPRRKIIARIGLVIFFLIFMPVPLITI